MASVPLQLIRDGAGMIRGAEDLLADLGRIDPRAAPPASPIELSPAGDRGLPSGVALRPAERLGHP